MKRLKTILQSRVFIFSILLFISIYISISTILIKYKSIYSNGENTLSGSIIKVTRKDDKINLIIKSKEKIYATYYTEDDLDINVGYKVLVKGIIDDPLSNTIPNTFNFKKYLYNNKIYKTLTINDIKVTNNKTNIFDSIKNSIYDKAHTNKYLSLFIIGDKSLLEDNIYNSFKDNGVAHLIAISGMHVSVFILILDYLLKYIKKSSKQLIISSFLLFYSFVVGFTPSIMRVVIMYFINIINNKYNLNIKPLYNLFYTMCILLIINSFNIYHIGFIYSFVTSFSIIVSKKFLKKNYFINIILITFFALLFTLPITISLNYEINLLTFIANLLLVPLITFIIYPFSLVTFIFVFLSPIFSLITTCLEKVMLLLDKITLFKIIISKPNIIFIIIYYSLLLLFIYFNNKKVLLIIFTLIIIHKYTFLIDKNNYVTFFDVGQGDSSVIISSYHKSITLIDTGGLYSNYHISDSYILYLKSIGISKVSNLVITHGDHDHMGEAINLVNNFKVENVIFNCGEFNDLEQELIKILDKKHINYYSCIYKLDNLFFLQTKKYDNENDNSNVIYTELDGHKFMFMGDAGIETEKDIMNKYNISNIDVLKVGHHGSRTSSSKEFINEISPRCSIISVGKKNRYGHPNKGVLDNLKESKIYRTDQYGSVMFKIEKDRLEIETYQP